MSEKPTVPYIIDRFEDNELVVVEHGDATFHLPRFLVPADAREGDVLKIEIRVDRQETKRRRKEIEELTRDLFIDSDS